jgi:hypothetical protein
MDRLAYEMLIEVNGRMEAEVIKSLLEANGVPVEIFQEAVGHHIYPVMIPGLGRVQLFVPKERLAEAQELLGGRSEPPA